MVSKSLSAIAIAVIAMVTLGLSNVQAQQDGRQLNRSQQFRMADRIIRVAEPGQLADSINVWGDVNSAGRYLIPKRTRLPELISYSFGPQTIRDRQSNLDWSKMRIEVKVSRFNDNQEKVNIANFEYKMDEPEPAGMFQYNLRNNDIVTLQVKRKPAFVDYVRVIAPVISTVATGFLIIDRL